VCSGRLQNRYTSHMKTFSYRSGLDLVSKYRYEALAVANGAIIMVLEIVGARIIAPHFGSSVYVWTAVIGVILAALSAGYWYGGRLADREASHRGLSQILLWAAATLLVALATQQLSLALAGTVASDLRWQALIAALLLFAPANFCMGMVSPYLAKLRLTNLQTAGSSLGTLYAAGTVGSIVGTFAAGYWLIGYFGSQVLGYVLVLALVATSVGAEARHRWLWRLAVALGAVFMLVAPGRQAAAIQPLKLLYDGDSAYSHYRVADVDVGGRIERLLMTDPLGAQSGIYLDNPNEPAFSYIQRFVETARAAGEPKRILLIGGGAYTLPRLLLAQHPQATVDVVEIDPKVLELASQYFAYKPDARVRVWHEDGRTFLNRNQQQYDLIYMDAFSSITPPFQLTTTEAVGRLSKAVGADGLVVVNLISDQTGAEVGFAAAQYATYLKNFAGVAIGQVAPEAPADMRQNLLLVAGANKSKVGRVAEATAIAGAPQLPVAAALTDDFAPVERLTDGFH
jgi:spermidine synthase